MDHERQDALKRKDEFDLRGIGVDGFMDKALSSRAGRAYMPPGHEGARRGPGAYGDPYYDDLYGPRGHAWRSRDYPDA